MIPDTIHCPAHIEFLLWCHTRVEPFPRLDVPIFSDLRDSWIAADVIEVDPRQTLGGGNGIMYRTTPLGRAWVQALCNVPIPKQVFIDEAGRVLT